MRRFGILVLLIGAAVAALPLATQPTDCGLKVQAAQQAVVDADALVRDATQNLTQALVRAMAAAASGETRVADSTKPLRDAVTTATSAKTAAVQNYQDVQQLCSSAATAIDCPTAIKAAQQAVTAAAAAVQSANAHYNSEMPKLDAAVTQANTAVHSATTQLNDDTYRKNVDEQILGQDQTKLQTAKNDLTSIEDSCKEYLLPHCPTLIRQAQADVDAAQAAVSKDEEAVAADEAKIDADKQALADANARYQSAVSTRDSTRTSLQQAIDKAESDYDSATKNLEAVEQECGRGVWVA